MSSKSRSQIRSTRQINSIDNGSSGNMEFGLPPITNKLAAVRLFLTGADPKRATMRCCNKRKTTIPMTFASGYQKPSYPSMRRFA